MLPPRKATLCDFRDAQGRAIDAGLAVYFPAPHSYTGEDVLELHGHGGPAVVDQLLRSCLEAGARLADPGEFTFRAFLNHRLDLAQAEAVADLIDAATARAARSAARSLKGEFSAEVNKLIDQLIDLRVRVEACLDFPEEDVEPFLAAPLADALDHLARQLSIIKAAAGRGAILREGATVVMSGPPNVGKSSLMNRLAGWDLAIVTDIPGTTRDALRETVEIDGVPVQLIDTAGLRDSADVVERLGIERAREAIKRADVTLRLFDASQSEPPTDAVDTEGSVIHVGNKIDLTSNFPQDTDDVIYVSAITGQGIDALKVRILGLLGWREEGELVYTARTRHLNALDRASWHLTEARGQHDAYELLAEHLRQAQVALSEIGGAVSSDELLGQIFSRFCIGK